MKILLLLLTFSFASLSFASFPPDSTNTVFEKGTAQFYISEGKRLYNEGEYRASLIKFREALAKDKKNAEATYWLAECHLALGNYDRAKDYAEEAISFDKNTDVEVQYLLGLCNHRMGNIDTAIVNFQLAQGGVSELRAKELKIAQHIASCERAKELMANPVKVVINGLGKEINSLYEETAPVLSPDGKTFYFVSRRADNLGGGISPGDEKYFEDIYVSVWNDSTQSWKEATNIGDLVSRLNTKGMDAVSHISSDGNTIYFTINTMVMKKPKPKTKHSDIFYSKKNNKGTWNSAKPMGSPINSFAFDAGFTMTADETVGYFISERLGGEGRSDIYTVTKVGNNWSKPVNLGKTINTPENETTVHVSPDGKYLFFSSKGHDSMGGYDVFVTTHNGEEWEKPVNLGYPINTVSDETHFVYYPKLNKAFYAKFSTAENMGLGARDLFEIDMRNYKLPF